MSLFVGRREFLIGSGALLLPRVPALAADHRDSPAVDADIATDITDIYMFRAPHDHRLLVMVMDTHPFSIADEAASYHYEPSALYRFNFTTKRTAEPTAEIDFIFSPFANGGQNFTAFFPNGTVVTGPVTQGTVTSTTPNPPMITQGPPGSGITIFAGPRDDPFFFDFVGFERFLAGTGTFTGTDAFAGFNVNSIVVQFPLEMVVGHAEKFGAWGVTYTSPQPLSTPPFVDLTQIDRMGNPAVNTALIPAALKDAFNAGIPQDDAQVFAPVILQTLANFGTNAQNTATLASVAVPDTLKLNRSMPDGFPNGRQLTDRVIDTLLTLILNTPTTDGTKGNDVPFLPTFPYLASPHQAP
jgi:hypothetical protein